MHIQKYTSKEEFLKDNLSLLALSEIENEVLVGILFAHTNEKISNWILGRVVDDLDNNMLENKNIHAIYIVDDDRNNLMVEFPNKENNIEISKLIIDDIVKSGIALGEIFVEKRYINMLLEEYISKTGNKSYTESHGHVYVLKNLTEEHILKENEKIIKLEDCLDNTKKLISVVKEIYVDIYHKEPCSDEEALKLAKVYLKKGTYILTNEDESKVYTQVVNVRKHINGCAIGAVITPKEYRGNGFAKRCVYGVCKKLLEEGNKFIVLYAISSNEPAIRVYEKIGFKKAAEFLRIKFAK